jgi:UDP-N-acetylmuramoyl-tripeptide--D-alanyl-D-alanine ligase
MKAALDLLCMADTNRVAILGDMGELGETEQALHKEVGAYAAAKDINVLVCVGKLSSNMYDGASEIYDRKSDQSKGQLSDSEILYFETREELIEALPSIIKKDDTILVKASHFMGFENVVKALL